MTAIKEHAVLFIASPFKGGAVASWIVCLSLNRAVWVQALPGDIVLCPWARHFTLTVPLYIKGKKIGTGELMLGVTLQWTSIPSWGE